MEHIIVDGVKQEKKPKRVGEKHRQHAYDIVHIVSIMLGVEKEEMSEALLEERARLFYRQVFKEGN